MAWRTAMDLLKNVELGEELGASRLVEKFLHHWDREFVFDRRVVERAVVHTEAPRAIYLADEERR